MAERFGDASESARTSGASTVIFRGIAPAIWLAVSG